jgi:Na+/glutamate symporter
VYVTVTPSNPSLSIEDQRVELVVPANGQARAIVPVESVANGSVTLTVAIASGSGDSVAAPAFLDLNVQAGWETAITGTFGVLVGLVFIGGIVRTILKRRRARSATEQGDVQSADIEADARG